jgi:hypothetical protein
MIEPDNKILPHVRKGINLNRRGSHETRIPPEDPTEAHNTGNPRRPKFLHKSLRFMFKNHCFLYENNIRMSNVQGPSEGGELLGSLDPSQI